MPAPPRVSSAARSIAARASSSARSCERPGACEGAGGRCFGGHRAAPGVIHRCTQMDTDGAGGVVGNKSIVMCRSSLVQAWPNVRAILRRQALMSTPRDFRRGFSADLDEPSGRPAPGFRPVEPARAAGIMKPGAKARSYNAAGHCPSTRSSAALQRMRVCTSAMSSVPLLRDAAFSRSAGIAAASCDFCDLRLPRRHRTLRDEADVFEVEHDVRGVALAAAVVFRLQARPPPARGRRS